jgi:ribosomal protein S5
MDSLQSNNLSISPAYSLLDFAKGSQPQNVVDLVRVFNGGRRYSFWLAIAVSNSAGESGIGVKVHHRHATTKNEGGHEKRFCNFRISYVGGCNINRP